jgi:hypothetical protein
MLVEHRGKRPSVDPSAYVAPNAVLCGDVGVGPDSPVLRRLLPRDRDIGLPRARLGRGVEVRIKGIVHVNTALEDGAMVPIGWVAVGNPARIGDPLLALAELVDLREPVAHLGCVEHLVGGSLGVLAAVPEAELQPATVADAHHLELTKPGEAPA